MNKDKVVGIGWSGRWNDGTLGWNLSYFVEGKYPSALNENQRDSLAEHPKYWCHSDMYRVKITVEVVRNKRGLPTIKRAKTTLKEAGP